MNWVFVAMFFFFSLSSSKNMRTNVSIVCHILCIFIEIAVVLAHNAIVLKSQPPIEHYKWFVYIFLSLCFHIEIVTSFTSLVNEFFFFFAKSLETNRQILLTRLFCFSFHRDYSKRKYILHRQCETNCFCDRGWA